MPAESPEVVERRFYHELLGLTDDGTLSLAELRNRSAGGANAAKSAESARAAVSANGIQGYKFVISDTKPPQFSEGLPVVWLRPTGVLTNVPSNPIEPIWDNYNKTITIPSGIVGVYYTYNGVVVAQGTVIDVPAVPSTAVVTAQAEPNYTLPAVYTYTHNFPDPAQQIVKATDSFSGADVTTLGGRLLDNVNGGVAPQLSYALQTNDPFGITGNVMVTKAVSGTVKINTGYNNHRLSLEIKSWPWAASSTDNPITLSVGGSVARGQGAFWVSFGPQRYRVQSVDGGGTKDYEGTSGISGVAQSLGVWEIEIYNRTLGLKRPGQGWVYYDTSAANLGSNMGPICSINNGNSGGTMPWTADNLVITGLGF